MHSLDLKALSRLVLAFAGAATLASCGGSDGMKAIGGPGGGAPPPPPQSVQGQLGIGFSMTFGAPANAEPRDPQAGDVVPISLSADPIDIPDPM